ncbi:helix-turn-helix domain-containing protein [Prevotella melaninogenica]
MKYHQLISEQRLQIFALLQKKTGRKEIAAIVGISQSTLSREIKRNSTPSGKYIWTKAHDTAMHRRKRTVKNARLSDELVWRIRNISPMISGLHGKYQVICARMRE